MEKNILIRAISKETGFAPQDVRKVLTALNNLVQRGNPANEVLEADEIQRFWACITAGIKCGDLVKDTHYRILSNELAMRWGAAYTAYAKHHPSLYGREANSNVYTLALIRRSPGFVMLHQSLRIGGTRSSAYVFTIAQIPFTV